MQSAIATFFLAGALAAAMPTQAQTLVERWLDGEVGPEPLPLTYDGPQITLRFNSFLAPQSTIAEVMVRSFECLSAETNGKLIVRPFWNNTLADAAAGGFDAVASGVADIGSCYTFMSPGGFTVQLGLQMPFLVESSAHGARVVEELYPKYFMDRYEGRGVYFARSSITPPQQVLSIRRAITKLDDFRGQRMWAVGKISTDVTTALGAAPVPLAPGELYTSFQSGVLDAVPMHDAGTVLFPLNELAKHRTKTDLSANAIEYCLNKAFFDGLPPDLKAIFYRWLQLWNHAESQLYFDAVAAQGIKTMTEAGVTFHEMEPQELDKFRERVGQVEKAWVQEIEAAGEPAQEFLEAFRARYAEVAPLSYDEVFQLTMDRPVDGLISGYDYPGN